MMKTPCLPYLDLDTLSGSGLTGGNLLSISVYLTQKDIKEVKNRVGESLAKVTSVSPTHTPLVNSHRLVILPGTTHLV